MKEIYLAVVQDVKPLEGGLLYGHTIKNQHILGAYTSAELARGKIYSTYQEHGDIFHNGKKRNKTIYAVEGWGVDNESDLDDSEIYTVKELSEIKFDIE